MAGAVLRLEHEPGTLVYACSEVEGAPNQRLFFELYADRAAYEAHGRQPHVQHFLCESKKHAKKRRSITSARTSASTPPGPYSRPEDPHRRTGRRTSRRTEACAAATRVPVPRQPGPGEGGGWRTSNGRRSSTAASAGGWTKRHRELSSSPRTAPHARSSSAQA
ncbi:putative quinol monooxygenase [Streptomyces albidocamelliae]|uniref:putative quinol monooxygenase n=1 Tax=Streptomyces albidocamelliae TaxID=2981135 RepID=UPI00384AE5EB